MTICHLMYILSEQVNKNNKNNNNNNTIHYMMWQMFRKDNWTIFHVIDDGKDHELRSILKYFIEYLKKFYKFEIAWLYFVIQFYRRGIFWNFCFFFEFFEFWCLQFMKNLNLNLITIQFFFSEEFWYLLHFACLSKF